MSRANLPDAPPLTFTTWLSPGLPLSLFETIADHVGTRLGRGVSVSVNSKISGPLRPEDDRFARGLTDVGFLCPPAYVWLRKPSVESVRLVPVAPVFEDPRNGGQPHYYSDVVVRASSPPQSFSDLGGCRFGYNDPSSLSGHLSVLSRLADDGLDPSFFSSFEQVGGHRQALERIVGGELDAAAIDANVLQAWRLECPEQAERIRSIEVLGPHPVQPVVVRTALAPVLVEPLAEALLDPVLAERTRAHGVIGFAPISDRDFDSVEAKMAFLPLPHS